MLPPMSFALFGWLAPLLVPKHGLDKPILLALGMIFLGIVGRSLSINVWMYSLLSIVCLGGIGMCNALLPPIIKQHFPNRFGLVTSIYTSLIYVSAGLPSLLAVPLTQAVGWRVSTGSWAVFALIAVVPWHFPPRIEFMCGKWFRAQFEKGEIPVATDDPDLALLLAQAERNSITLSGSKVEEVLDHIPWIDIQRAMRDSLPGLMASI